MKECAEFNPQPSTPTQNPPCPTTYRRCDQTVSDLASELLCKYDSHKPTVEARVRIDFVFAMPDLDENGQPMNDALKKNGVKALGVTRKLGLKDRALGRADAEIALDHHWWTQAGEDMQRALMDHELHHIAVVLQKETGKPRLEEDGRPKIRLRKHDYEFGWFRLIAARHREHSLERIQARQMLDESGQYFWPELVK